MTIEQIRESLEAERIKTQTLEVVGAIGKSTVYTVSVPRGRNAVRAWLDLQHGFSGYWAIITGEWTPPLNQERNDVTRLLKKASRLAGTKVLEQLKQKFAKDWRWHGDCDLADDGIPERLHGKWPKKPKPREGFSFAWDTSDGRNKSVQMMLLPMANDLDAPAWLGFGDRDGYPPPETHLALLRHWNETYGLELFGMNLASFELLVNRPPKSRKAALQLAWEQFFYCPDLVVGEEGTGTVEKLAAQLLKSHSWHFRWDGSIYQTLNTRMTAKESWRVYFDKERDSYKEILSWDSFEGWESSRRPELAAEDEFGYALKILYSGIGKNLSNRFLEVAKERLKRAIREGKFKSKICKSHYPTNVARATRCLEYIEALLSGKFTCKPMLEASGEFDKARTKGKWSDISESEYLNSVRMALICGDRQLAKKRLAIKKPFKWNKQEAKIWKQLASVEGKLPLDNESLLAELDAWFDDLRHATYRSESMMNTDMVRFEAAAIRYKYFESKDGEIDWKQVIKQVTRKPNS